MLSALRGILKECWRLGYTSAEDYERAQDLAPVRGETLPKGRPLSGKELRMLFDACAEDEKPGRGVRDAVMLATLYVCGFGESQVYICSFGSRTCNSEGVTAEGEVSTTPKM